MHARTPLAAVLVGEVALANPTPDTHSTERKSWNICPGFTEPVIRFPPSVRNNTPSDWLAPPYAWIFGSWHVQYSSRLEYQALYNFQADTYPRFPTDNSDANARVNIDLTSYNLPPTGNASLDGTVFTAFGYDTPLVDLAPYVFRFNGTGDISSVSNVWELLGWGYDDNGNAWRVEYETAVQGPQFSEPCINFVSRAEDGPSNTTLAKIYKALHRRFDGTELQPYIANVTKLQVDGRRTGSSPVACDESCQMNAVSPPM